MGTDIHILVEFYDKDTERWILMKWNFSTQKYEPAKVKALKRFSDETDEDFEERSEIYYDNLPIESIKRDYSLFALLANVCNENCIIPWSLPKRFPYDVSQEAIIAAQYTAGIEDSLHHNHTWYTTVELQYIFAMFNESELAKIVNRAYGRCPLSRLLFWFDN